MTRLFLFSALLALAALIPPSARPQATGGVRFLSHYVPPSGGSYVAGCWGWTDTSSGREYAILGSYCGTSLVEVTNPLLPVERDFVPGVCSSWREIQVHDHYAYVVSEGGGGVQIIDLSYLPDSAHLVQNFYYFSGGGNITRSHTLHIKDGYMYLNGCANWGVGGVVIFSLANPESPAFASAYENRYYHDSFVRNDTMFGATLGGGIEIVDVSNKLSPVHLYNITYAGSGTHNLATTEDGQYLLSTDEVSTTPKTVKIWDLRNPPAFPKVAEYTGYPAAIVHNVFVKGTIAYLAHYTAGFRAFSVSDPENPVELGGYDTYAGGDGIYDGAWSTYPYFPSGTIIIGDMESGLYVVDLNPNAPKAPVPFAAYSDHLMPTAVALSWTDPTQTIIGGTLSGLKLHLYRDDVFLAEVDSGVGAFADTGLTTHQPYVYKITAVVPGDSSQFSVDTVYAGGHPQPRPVSNFSALDASAGVLLSWRNPTRQMDNAPLDDLGAILVYRDGVLATSLLQAQGDTGLNKSYTDTVSGYHSYRLVVADTELPIHYSPPSDSLMAYGMILTGYTEDFEGGTATMLTTGTWDTTGTLGDSGSHSLTDSPGGNYPAGGSVTYALTPAVKIGAGWVLQLRHIGIILNDGLGLIDISRNHRTTYKVLKGVFASLHSEWMDGVAGPGDWFTERFDLSVYAGDTAVFRFRLLPGSTVPADGWYIDNIYVGPAASVLSGDYPVTSGWNLVSLPGNVADGSVPAVYPTSSLPAFGYNGSYVDQDTLAPLNGYWLKFNAPDSVPITFATILRDTVDLAARWNLIGGLSDEVTGTGIKTLPNGILASPFYAYDGAYNPVSSLAPGQGYWVKASSSGKLVLSAFTGEAAPVPAPARPEAQVLTTLTFTDASGKSQRLMLAPASRAGELSRFELPPLPPPDGFDIRFSSGRLLAVAEAGEKSLIAAQGVRYPLRVAWSAGSVPLEASLIAGGRRLALSGSGVELLEQSVADLAVEFLAAASGEIPDAYALGQNYPNPFNPVTTIRYQLPAATRVKLTVYDMLGREIRTLVDGVQDAGYREVEFTAAGLPSGVYVYKLQAGSFTDVRKMSLMK